MRPAPTSTRCFFAPALSSLGFCLELSSVEKSITKAIESLLEYVSVSQSKKANFKIHWSLIHLIPPLLAKFEHCSWWQITRVNKLFQYKELCFMNTRFKSIFYISALFQPKFCKILTQHVLLGKAFCALFTNKAQILKHNSRTCIVYKFFNLLLLKCLGLFYECKWNCLCDIVY